MRAPFFASSLFRYPVSAIHVCLEAGLVSLQASLVLLQPLGRVRQRDAVPDGLGEGHTRLLEGRGGVGEGRLRRAKAGVVAIERQEREDGAVSHQDGGEASKDDKECVCGAWQPSFGCVWAGATAEADVRLHRNTPTGRTIANDPVSRMVA